MEEYEQFIMTPDLAETIIKIINNHEEEEYVCKIMDCVVPEHQEVIYHIPKNNIINKYCERKNKKERKYTYLVIMKAELLPLFQELVFNKKKDINYNLYLFDAAYMEYFGDFKPEFLVNKFPYLEEFFNRLYKWREETGRVTIDADVLVRSRKKLELL